MNGSIHTSQRPFGFQYEIQYFIYSILYGLYLLMCWCSVADETSYRAIQTIEKMISLGCACQRVRCTLHRRIIIRKWNVLFVHIIRSFISGSTEYFCCCCCWCCCLIRSSFVQIGFYFVWFHVFGFKWTDSKGNHPQFLFWSLDSSSTTTTTKKVQKNLIRKSIWISIFIIVCYILCIIIWIDLSFSLSLFSIHFLNFHFECCRTVEWVQYSFVQEFVAAPLDGVSLLLEVLRSIQLSQQTTINQDTIGKVTAQTYQRRALLDELAGL